MTISVLNSDSERKLVLSGRGKQRLISCHNFFVLAGAAGWVGRVELVPKKSVRWQLIYTGPFSQQYYKLISNSHWPERVKLEEVTPNVAQ